MAAGGGDKAHWHRRYSGDHIARLFDNAPRIEVEILATALLTASSGNRVGPRCGSCGPVLQLAMCQSQYQKRDLVDDMYHVLKFSLLRCIRDCGTEATGYTYGLLLTADTNVAIYHWQSRVGQWLSDLQPIASNPLKTPSMADRATLRDSDTLRRARGRRERSSEETGHPPVTSLSASDKFKGADDPRNFSPVSDGEPPDDGDLPLECLNSFLALRDGAARFLQERRSFSFSFVGDFLIVQSGRYESIAMGAGIKTIAAYFWPGGHASHWRVCGRLRANRNQRKHWFLDNKRGEYRTLVLTDRLRIVGVS